MGLPQRSCDILSPGAQRSISAPVAFDSTTSFTKLFVYAYGANIRSITRQKIATGQLDMRI
jgi:hypothetical protein